MSRFVARPAGECDRRHSGCGLFAFLIARKSPATPCFRSSSVSRPVLPKRLLIGSAVAFIAGWPLPAFASMLMLDSSTISGTNLVCTNRLLKIYILAHRFEQKLINHAP